jgi:hypothetical protein
VLSYDEVVKTTIEINDELLRRAKVRAAERGETLRALVERGLQRELNESADHPTEYVLPDVSVGGSGLKPEFSPWHWDRVRDLAYEDRDS